MAAMDLPATWISLVALAFGGLSLWISFRAFRRTSRYQDFEYMPRLQISSSPVHFGSNIEPRFDFDGSLENKGSKPIRIREVLMDVGHPKDRKKQHHSVIAQDFFIGAGDEWPVEFHKTSGEMQDAMKKLDSAQCTFSLRVTHEDSSGKLIEGRYPLGGFGREGSLIVIVGVGQALIYR
jgi:hypothetical protein